jgi:hypothetical protein
MWPKGTLFFRVADKGDPKLSINALKDGLKGWITRISDRAKEEPGEELVLRVTRR